jgi:hypothetical protein
VGQLMQSLTRDRLAIFRVPVPVRGVIYALGMLCFMVFGEYGGNAFIYFQF